VGALRHGERHHAIDPDAGQQQREPGKQAHLDGLKAARREGIAAHPTSNRKGPRYDSSSASAAE